MALLEGAYNTFAKLCWLLMCIQSLAPGWEGRAGGRGERGGGGGGGGANLSPVFHNRDVWYSSHYLQQCNTVQSYVVAC